jgi:predicted DNA-binding transcriptional regulator YafY
LKREPVTDRLDRLTGLLASRPSWTAPQLAEELGVCLRTVRRDLARLGARGVPIHSEPGRGGGLRTPARTGLGRVQLNTQEMLDLLLALAITEQLHSPLLLATVRGLRQKIAASFPAAERARASQLRKRILVGPSTQNIASSWQQPRAAVLQPIQEAFFTQQTLQLKYRTQDSRTTRTVEPHYLLSSWPAWYLIVWDHLRSGVRALRLDRIESAQLAGTPFRLREAEAMLPKAQEFYRPL